MTHERNESEPATEIQPAESSAGEQLGLNKLLANIRPRSGAGRPPGSPNRATAAAREAFQLFVEGNLEKIQTLFDRVAKDDPKGALELLLKLSEFVLPRLQRSTIDGEIELRRGGPMEVPDFSRMDPHEAAAVYQRWMRES